jgi:tetratricopeptide (TPR) repeat protein
VAIEIDPLHVNAYANRGAVYAQKGRHDLAIADLTKAIELDPRHAGAYYNRGTSPFAKRDYDRALADFTKTIDIDPENAAAYQSRGRVHRAKRDYDRAITDFTKAIEAGGRRDDAYSDRGLAYESKRDYDRAIADFTKVIEISPRQADAYYNRGRAHQGKREYDRVIADYDKAIEINPRHLASLSREQAISMNALAIRNDRAIADATRAIEINPKDADAYSRRQAGWTQAQTFEELPDASRTGGFRHDEVCSVPGRHACPSDLVGAGCRSSTEDMCSGLWPNGEMLLHFRAVLPRPALPLSGYPGGLHVLAPTEEEAALRAAVLNRQALTADPGRLQGQQARRAHVGCAHRAQKTGPVGGPP